MNQKRCPNRPTRPSIQCWAIVVIEDSLSRKGRRSVSSGARLLPVAASPELLDESGVGRLPAELGASPGSLSSLVEEENFRK